MRGTLAGGAEVSVSGTLSGPRTSRRSSSVGGFDVDLVLTDHMAFLRYDDRRAWSAAWAASSARRGINIAGMQVARASAGGEAMVALTIDNVIPPLVLTEISGEIGATSARFINNLTA